MSSFIRLTSRLIGDKITQGGTMKINREWAMPNASTFNVPCIFQLINETIKKYGEYSNIIDPFVRNSPFKKNYGIITNDLDLSIEADHHMDALDFLKTFKNNSIDLVLFDPPYSPRQVSECYKKMGKTVNMQTTQASFWSNMKKEISRITKLNGTCITFGWNSGGIGLKYGFEIKEILLVAHGGWHNDTICTLENKIQSNF
jgi:hypothetical protein